MKIIFFGTPLFAAEILTYLIEKNLNIVAIVTQSDKRRGNVSEVKKVANKLLPDIDLLQPEKATDPIFLEKIKSYDADLFVVVAYGKILRQNLLDTAKKDCINVHASLLPKYRGAAPIQRAIINGDDKTGVTIMQMVREMDAGDIIKQKEVEITKKMNFKNLYDALIETAKPLLLEVIKMYEKEEVKKYPQDENLVTFAPKITFEDLLIDFNKDAKDVYNQIRAFSPVPGAFCNVKIDGQIKKLKILECEISSFEGLFKEIVQFEKKSFVIACKKGAISILKLQLEGKKIVSVDDFIRGMKKSFNIC